MQRGGGRRRCGWEGWLVGWAQLRWRIEGWRGGGEEEEGGEKQKRAPKAASKRKHLGLVTHGTRTTLQRAFNSTRVWGRERVMEMEVCVCVVWVSDTRTTPYGWTLHYYFALGAGIHSLQQGGKKKAAETRFSGRSARASFTSTHCTNVSCCCVEVPRRYIDALLANRSQKPRTTTWTRPKHQPPRAPISRTIDGTGAEHAGRQAAGAQHTTPPSQAGRWRMGHQRRPPRYHSLGRAVAAVAPRSRQWAAGAVIGPRPPCTGSQHMHVHGRTWQTHCASTNQGPGIQPGSFCSSPPPPGISSARTIFHS